MTDDRALLEAAAKAAGIRLVATKPGYPLWIDGQGVWNPLTDDGDALRLAIALHMTVARRENINGAFAYAEVPGQMFCPEPLSGGAEPNAATRRAIVRAAAAAGEQKG